MRRQLSAGRPCSSRPYKCELSPYDKNYRGCIKSDQRDLIFEHQRVAKMSRRDLEDSYISLCDEHFTLKRENHANQEKIKRLITKLLRITSFDIKSTSNRSRETLSVEERVQLRIFDLEMQNSQLREKLTGICKKYGLPLPSARPYSELRDRTGSQLTFDEPVPSPQEEVKISESPKQEELLKEYRNRIEELTRELEDLKEELKGEHRKNKELFNQVSELRLRKHIAENVQLIHIREKMDELKREFKSKSEKMDEMIKQSASALNEEKRKNGDLQRKLTEQSEKSDRFARQIKELEQSKRLVEELREQLTEAESEKQSLKTQQERFSMLLKETSTKSDKFHDLQSKNDTLQASLDEAKSSVIALLHSKSELVEKIVTLQNDYDRISVELEGFRSRAQFLSEENDHLNEKLTRISIGRDQEPQDLTKETPKVSESGAKMCTSITSITSDGSRSDTSVSLTSDTFAVSPLEIPGGRSNYDSFEGRNRLEVLDRAALHQPFSVTNTGKLP
ncbi:intraflagellar transport protein 74 homolog [Phlebotomus argentipes]|uniref:intraflagellar transport protein 74 homolog n=1 Tax=Phlebotomus argentipes TaxID=94469 RepID=UPI002892F8BD|nr:intraflagellar transport protein 74 homolog [Phlebotomus argentipes]